MTAFVHYREGGIEIIFSPRIPVPQTGTTSSKVAEMIQESADRLAAHLKNHVTDWHMLQRIWIDGDFKERE